MIPKRSLTFDGQADNGKFDIRDDLGNPAHLKEVIFPVLKVIDGKWWSFIGTAFFIASNGLFVTAKHVLQDAIDSKSNNVDPLFIVQWLHDGTYLIRKVRGFVLHHYADIGIGWLQPLRHTKTGEPLTTNQLVLASGRPILEETVFTYAYPKTIIKDGETRQSIFLYPGYYTGRIKEYYPNGRDRVLLPFPCYRTSIVIHYGASGGPVFNLNGHVFGINSTGVDGSTDISFVSRIADIFDMTLPYVQIENSAPISMTMFELARQGHLSFNPPFSP